MHYTNYIFVTGLGRSGNHAIQTWLTGVVGKPFTKLNYCPSIMKRGDTYKKMVTEHQGEGMSLIQGAEQLNPIRFDHPDFFTADNVKQVIILRHPWNNFVSQAKALRDRWEDDKVAQWLDIWAYYADEFLGHTSLLPEGSKVTVNYDRWFVDVDYRAEICEEGLGLEWNDATLNMIDENWGFSSFDDMSFQGRAQHMDVLNRWKLYKDDERFHRFVRMLDDHRAGILMREEFGPPPARF